MLKILLSRVRKMKKGKPEEEKGSLKNYNKAIKSNPDNPDGYFNRANLKFKLGSYQDAIKDYNRAIRLNPEHLQAYHSRAKRQIKLLQRSYS